MTGMTIKAISVHKRPAGWRDYSYVKLTTENGTVGWAEFDEGFGSAGVGTIIERLTPLLLGQDARSLERHAARLLAATRPAPSGVAGQAAGALSNALLDVVARDLGVPCYALLGGKTRDRIPVYWSHCATWRVNYPQWYGPAIKTESNLRSVAAEVREKGFAALKTNIIIPQSADSYRAHLPGFGHPFQPELNLDASLLRAMRHQLTVMREGAGADVDILLDLNHNFRVEGLRRITHALADQNLMWLEVDVCDPTALAQVKATSPIPIASCETLIGLAEFLPYLERRAVDFAIIDVMWNGAWEAMKIAAACRAFDVNIAPHGFSSHLSTMMNAHFCAAIPNLKIMEVDIDRLDAEDTFVTVVPQFSDGKLIVPESPGWGTEPVFRA